MVGKQIPISIKLFGVFFIERFASIHVILNKSSKICHSSLNYFCCNFCRMLHGRGAVNLYQPYFIVLVDHEVIPEKLKCVLSKDNVLFDAFQRLNSNFFHLWPNNLLKYIFFLFVEKHLRKVFHAHHILLNSILLVIDSFCDWVIR